MIFRVSNERLPVSVPADDEGPTRPRGLDGAVKYFGVKKEMQEKEEKKTYVQLIGCQGPDEIFDCTPRRTGTASGALENGSSFVVESLSVE